MRSAALIFALALACGGEGAPIEPDGGTEAPPADGGAMVFGEPIPEGGGRFELIGGDWTLGPGGEGYRCVRRTIDRDIYIRELNPIDPDGTHHTVVTYMEDSSIPDESIPCSVVNHAPKMIFGSGVGTEPFVMPEGVAIRIPAGAQVMINLHLFNAGSEHIEGHSGLEVVTVPPSEVVHEAGSVLAGDEFFTIPAMASDHWITGRCTMDEPTTLFALFPHMHQYGDYQRVHVETATGDALIFEDTYSFDDQRYRHIEPIELQRGDRIRVDCRYQNPTSSNVRWGDSSLTEMCYAGLLFYPPRPFGLSCTR